MSIPEYSNKTFYHINPSSCLSVFSSFIIYGLLFCYSNSPSIVCSVHEVTYPCLLFSFDRGQEVFNFGLLPNLWCFLSISPCNAHVILSIPLGHFEIFVSDLYVRTGRMHWLYTFLFSDNGRLSFITLCCLPKTLHPILIHLLIFFSWSGHALIFCSNLMYFCTCSITS